MENFVKMRTLKAYISVENTKTEIDENENEIRFFQIHACVVIPHGSNVEVASNELSSNGFDTRIGLNPRSIRCAVFDLQLKEGNGAPGVHFLSSKEHSQPLENGRLIDFAWIKPVGVNVVVGDPEDGPVGNYDDPDN